MSASIWEKLEEARMSLEMAKDMMAKRGNDEDQEVIDYLNNIILSLEKTKKDHHKLGF